MFVDLNITLKLNIMKNTFTFIILMFIIAVGNAQDGTLDTSFGINGKLDIPIYARALQFDFLNNKLVLVGSNTSYQPTIMRLNLDGSFDNSFDSDGIQTINFGSTVDILNSLHIINGNYYVSSYSKGAFSVVSAATGSATNIFYNSWTYTTGYHDVIIKSDLNDKPIIITDDNDFSSNSVKIFRYNTNNTLDTSFNGTGFVNNTFYGYGNLAGAEIDELGNIYVSKSTSDGTYYSIYTKKFNSTGSLDNTYTLDGNNTNNRSLTNSKIVFDFNGESYSCGMNNQNRFLIAKRNSTGTADTSFGSGGYATIDFTDTYYDNVRAIAAHEFDNSFKIILVGRTRAQATTALSNISLARIDTNGILDTSFGTAGKTSVATPQTSYTEDLYSAIDYDNGKLYVFASCILYRFNLPSILLSSQNFDSANKKVLIYPNPAQSQITFSEEIYNLEMFDISGKKVKSFSNNSCIFDVSDLDTGIYFLRGKTTTGNLLNEKLIKD